MTAIPANEYDIVELRSGSDQGTAITASDDNVLATDLKDARLAEAMEGLLILSIEACDDTDGDETYVVSLIGRESDSGTYADLVAVTVTRGTTGLVVANVTDFDKQLNYSVDVGGTTPSITFGLALIVTKSRYQPADGTTVISA